MIGGAVAAATGADIGRGFMMGAISGAFFGAVGGLGLQGLAQTAAHAVAGAASGAVNASITGGDVGMGALIGGISAGASEWLGNNVGFLQPVTGKGFGAYLNNIVRRAAIGAIVGGATSAAFGGSFGEGARLGGMTAAIAYTANEALHKAAEKAASALNTQKEPGPTKDVNKQSSQNNQTESAKSKGVNWKTVGIGSATAVGGISTVIGGIVAGTAATTTTSGAAFWPALVYAGGAVSTGITLFAVGVSDIILGIYGQESVLVPTMKAIYDSPPEVTAVDFLH